jgi:hypothetical protein
LFLKRSANILVVSFNKKKRGGFIKPYKQNKIEFVRNNFGFNKNMQGDRCMMMHDATMT